MRTPFPVVGFAAATGVGKTTLLLKLIPLLKACGLRIALIKRAHHSFDTDRPGKDSFELRKAGASQVLVASDRRLALVVENDLPMEPTLTELLEYLRPDALDLVLVEGYKLSPIPKIEIYRPSLGRPLLAASDSFVIAVATDEPDSVPAGIPALHLNRPEEVAEFICREILAPATSAKTSVPAVRRYAEDCRRVGSSEA